MVICLCISFNITIMLILRCEWSISFIGINTGWEPKISQTSQREEFISVTEPTMFTGDQKIVTSQSISFAESTVHVFILKS